MANKRIKDLTTTATLPAADDYFELDGATLGSRKLAWSALSQMFTMRPPLPGVCFDGTSGARILGTCQAIGTDSVSIVQVIDVPTANPTNSRGLWYLSSSSSTTNVARAFFAEMKTAGEIVVWLIGATAGDQRILTYSGIVAAYGGRRVVFTFVRDAAGTFTLYANGVALTGSESTAGTPPAWGDTITSTYYAIGNNASTTEAWANCFHSFSIYNLALSAADAVDIFVLAGAVPARFQFGSQTGLVTGDDSTFASDSGFWTKNGTATISGGALNLAADNDSAQRNSLLASRRQYRAVAVLTTNTAATGFRFYNGGLPLATHTGTGTKTTEFTAAGDASPANSFYLLQAGAGSVVVDSVTLTRIGAIVHLPLDDGIGYQLHDASSNKLDAFMSVTGVGHLIAKRDGYVRTPGTGLSWAGSHEAKNLLGAPSTQRMLPDGAVVTLITLKSTAGSSGSGAALNSTNTAGRWSAAAAITTAKSVRTVANQLPAGTADADTDILLDPDTANITATITAEVRYQLTEGSA